MIQIKISTMWVIISLFLLEKGCPKHPPGRCACVVVIVVCLFTFHLVKLIQGGADNGYDGFAEGTRPKSQSGETTAGPRVKVHYGRVHVCVLTLPVQKSPSTLFLPNKIETPHPLFFDWVHKSTRLELFSPK